jgi:hypothetical protein
MKAMAPCLSTSPIHPAISMHGGWVAARNGEPQDATQCPAWLEGWTLWHLHHPCLDTQLTACVTALRSILRPADAPRPHAQPWI